MRHHKGKASRHGRGSINVHFFPCHAGGMFRVLGRKVSTTHFLSGAASPCDLGQEDLAVHKPASFHSLQWS